MDLQANNNDFLIDDTLHRILDIEGHGNYKQGEKTALRMGENDGKQQLTKT